MGPAGDSAERAYIKGYSVTAEVFNNMVDAERFAHNAWDQIFTLGQTSVDQMRAVCDLIEEAQMGG